MTRDQEAELPGRQPPQELGMAAQERPEVYRGLAVQQVQEQVRSAVAVDADGQLVGEVPHGLLGLFTTGQVRQLVGPESRALSEVLDLVSFASQPLHATFGQYCVKQHQSLYRPRKSRRTAMTVVWLADRGIERLALDV